MTNYDRRNAKIETNIVEPLYGYDSEENAYIIEDYPYGSLRTKMKVWLEFGGKKGWRLISQTQNPKNGKWNAPKKSTYMPVAANMYLDNVGHVKWTGLSEYASAEDYYDFVKKFPKTNLTRVKQLVPAHIKYTEKTLSGEVGMTINNVRVNLSEKDIERYTKDLETWQEVQKLLH